MKRRAVTLMIVAMAASTAVTPPAHAEETDAVYTMLGRAYAAMFGYPADEVPPTGEDEPAPAPIPDQTCPVGQRGVDKVTAARIARAGDTADLPETPMRIEDAAPTPRGQPIRFDFGMADTSVRSDPGAHSIAGFFYVDLGGTQDEWTSVETDAWASGHARTQERCAKPFAGSPGTADDVHVISRSTRAPSAYAYNQTDMLRLGPAATIQTSVTVAETGGGRMPAWTKLIALAQGITIGELTVDEVTTVVHFLTDGTKRGTKLKSAVTVAGARYAGQPVDLRAGARPVAVGDLLVGVMTAEVRRLADGTIEVDAGGLMVGAEAPNPAGLQAKQALHIAGARLTASAGRLTRPGVTRADVPVFAPPTADQLPRGGSVFLPPAVPAPAAPLPVAQPPAVAPAAIEIRKVGVYRRRAFPVAPTGVGLIAVGSLLVGTYGWARRRPGLTGLVSSPALRWFDHAYRAFLRG